ncbi:HEAT repeat domain-containing protein [Candidatus Uabimicrobium amorphum]|uniref:Phycocyanobilin lyase n=1 Tax=Uabimicrobium amorphum TaxID=2596890 RepID=A0A5S9IS87_UABAM|nr:HEAT repeat domain-containing protein [Candidatus Uabimicrobium amorphum]BBM86964.1 phycocyanobilin lyase [Candidatus Uabimicrobium amorphum]
MDKEYLQTLITAENVDVAVVPQLINLFAKDELKYSAAQALGNVITQCPSVIQIVRDKLHNSCSNTQYYIILSLRYANNAQVFIPDLITFLKSTNDNIREITANTLGEIHDRRSVPHLLKLMCEDPNYNVRYYAMHALGDLKDTTTISQLIELIQGGNEETKMYSIHILGKMGENAKEAIPVIFPNLEDNNPKMVAIAATALGNMGDERARSVLQEISQTGSPSFVLSARKALRHLDESN